MSSTLFLKRSTNGGLVAIGRAPPACSSQTRAPPRDRRWALIAEICSGVTKDSAGIRSRSAEWPGLSRRAAIILSCTYLEDNKP
jgi:hypothetical protein